MDKQVSLPGIAKIGVFNAENMSTQMLNMSMAGLPVPLLCSITPITFFGEAECSITTKNENNTTSTTVLLKFDTAMPIPYHPNRGFVVKTPDGTSYAVASRQHPLPVVTFERETGTPGRASSVYHYQVSLVSANSCFDCIANF